MRISFLVFALAHLAFSSHRLLSVKCSLLLLSLLLADAIGDSSVAGKRLRESMRRLLR
jgi:hypothetical protein